jgi:hypothetical protein
MLGTRVKWLLVVLQCVPSRGSFINFLRLATDGFTNIMHTEGVMQHGTHVTTLFQAFALFSAFTLFSATGSRVCDTGMTRTSTRNSRPARGFTVHIPQTVSRSHSPTPCQVGKNVIWGVTLVISAVLTWAVNFSIGCRTVSNGKFHECSTPLVILCHTPTC